MTTSLDAPATMGENKTATMAIKVDGKDNCEEEEEDFFVIVPPQPPARKKRRITQQLKISISSLARNGNASDEIEDSGSREKTAAPRLFATPLLPQEDLNSSNSRLFHAFIENPELEDSLSFFTETHEIQDPAFIVFQQQSKQASLKKELGSLDEQFKKGRNEIDQFITQQVQQRQLGHATIV
jgi:hypothetical protein